MLKHWDPKDERCFFVGGRWLVVVINILRATFAPIFLIRQKITKPYNN